MRFFVIFIFSLFCIFPQNTFAEEPNAGFVKGLWYSAEPVFDGVPTRIYVAMRNNTGHDLTSTVHFTDNGKRIGTFEVSALEGRLVEAWVDWEPTYGEHTIIATVSGAKLHIIGGDTESIDIAGITASDTLMVEYDTDSDGVGNAEDTDDDNDTVSDTDETVRGSDPLVENPHPKNTEEPEEVLSADTLTRAPEALESHAEQGLEQFIDAGATDTFLAGTTQKIERMKTSLDTYRTKRSNALIPEAEVAEDSSTETGLGTYTDTATITRSQLPSQDSFLSSFVSRVAVLLSKLWTFVLYVISKILSYPAILEATLLLVILAVIYRTARRLGRRNRY